MMSTDGAKTVEVEVAALSGNSFDEVISGSTEPVLVDFWADWCGPCRIIEPVLVDLAQEYAGRLNVARVNVDDEQALALRFGVMSIPSMILFRGGEEVERIVGARPKAQLAKELEPYLA
jgi:thioredoxin 1